MFNISVELPHPPELESICLKLVLQNAWYGIIQYKLEMEGKDIVFDNP